MELTRTPELMFLKLDQSFHLATDASLDLELVVSGGAERRRKGDSVGQPESEYSRAPIFSK